ncbi:MAG: glycosyltransferase [Bacteroidales bacterium]|nr:glycosyltransferase [Bacteroidales bacterium]
MKISVIFPVYNVEKFVYKSFLSLINQDYNDYEIIIINDATQDNSLNIINEIIKTTRHLNIVLFEQAVNKGLSAARNKGIELSSGDYIFFMDSDDIITKDCLSTLAEEIDNNRFDIVLGEHSILLENKSLVHKPLSANGAFIGNEIILSKYLNNYWPLVAWNKLLNRNFILDNKLFFKDGILHEDVLWTFMLALKADSMYIINKSTYYYVKRDNSITSSYNKKNFEGEMLGILEMLDISIQYENIEIYSYILDSYFVDIKKALLNNIDKILIINYRKEIKPFYLPLILKYLLNKDITRVCFVLSLLLPYWLLSPYMHLLNIASLLFKTNFMLNKNCKAI